MTETSDTVPEIRVAAYPFPWRVVVASFYAVSRVSVVCIGLLVLAGMHFSPPLLLRLLVFLGLLPALVAVLISRAFTAKLIRNQDGWQLLRGGVFRRGERIELNPEAVRSMVPWWLPAPGLGTTLKPAGLRGQGRMELQADAEGRLIDLAIPEPDLVPLRPALAYTRARSASTSAFWRSFTAKFVLFPMVPTFILFRLHQYIQYGGMWGQYHLHGLQPYLSTLVFHWVLVLMYLVLWASVLRAFGELAAAGVARLNPGKAIVVREWVERVVSFLYYSGVIGLIAVRASL